MKKNEVHFPHATLLQDAVMEIVKKAGRKPEEVYAVFDKADAVATWVRPESSLKELLVLFTDWTFLLVDASKLVRDELH